VRLKGNRAAFADLLVPGEAEGMCRKAGDHVVKSVAIDIIGVHLRAACSGEKDGMRHPFRITFERRGLFPPPVFFEQVGAAIAVHIADSHTVSEISVLPIGSDAMPRPGFAAFVQSGEA
jgi:hypothetical protein